MNIHFTKWQDVLKHLFGIQLKTGCTLLIALSFIAVNIQAQTTFTTADLLANIPDNALDSAISKNKYYLEYLQSDLPMVEEMDIRSETDEWELARQEYLLRFSFNSKATRNIHKKVKQNNIDQFDIKIDQLNEDKLENRYEHIANWHYADIEIKDLQDKRILIEDKITVLKKLLNNSLEIDLDNLLKAEEILRNINLKLLRLELKRSFAISQLVSDESQLETAELESKDWISLSTMKEVLNEWKLKPTQNTEQALQKTRIQSAQLELEEENAEQNQIIDFVQVKYAGRQNLPFQKELSVGMGLKIPFKSGAQQQINQAYLEKFDEIFELEVLNDEITTRLEEYYLEFNSLIQQYEFVEEQIKSADLSATFNRLRKMEAVNPLSLLLLKESMLNNQSSLLEIEEDLCKLYIKIIKLKGMISLAPINFLSENLQIFD